jgi:hypothetical protein
MHWPLSCCRSPARTADIFRKSCFRGRPCMHATACVPGPCLYAGCSRAACVSGGSRGNGMGAGGQCLAPRVGSVRWSGPARNTPRMRAVCEWTGGGLGDLVSSCGAGSGMRGRLVWCGVRWPFQGCCSGGRLRHWTSTVWRKGGLRKRS